MSSVARRLNIAIHLSSMAARQPHALAVVVPDGRDKSGRVRYTHLTYRQLDHDSNRIAHGFKATGTRRGSRAVVMVPPSLDFFSLVFGLFKAGVVPVLIDPGIGLRNLKQCCREAAPEVFIGIPKALWAQRILGWGRETVSGGSWSYQRAPGASGLSIKTLDDLRRLGLRHLASEGPVPARSSRFWPPMRPPRSSSPAAAPGPPKGAVYTHAIFEAQVDAFRTLYSIEPGEIDLCTFPLFALFAPALGMTAIVPEMNPTRPAHVDPAKIFEAIDDFGVTNLFGSPALLRRLVEGAATTSVRLPSVKRVISAGAPVSHRVVEGVARLLVSPAQVHTPYGATEALPVASIGSDEILGETRRLTDEGIGVCVGRPVDGIDVKIIRIRDDAIPVWSDDLVVPDGLVGEIVVSGPGRHPRVLQSFRGHPVSPRSPIPRGEPSITAWVTWATATTTDGSGSAVASRNG